MLSLLGSDSPFDPPNHHPGVVKVFRDYFPLKSQGLKSEIREQWGENTQVSYWCQDETRLGYRTQHGRQITLRGVKPTQALQWHTNTTISMASLTL